MQLRRLSNFFTITGVVVGSIALIGYSFDLVPQLPESVLKLVIYKLTFIGALGLVIFGAIIGRLASKPGVPSGQTVTGSEAGPLLSEPSPGGIGIGADAASGAPVHPPSPKEN